jgi:hypothetical protein
MIGYYSSYNKKHRNAYALRKATKEVKHYAAVGAISLIVTLLILWGLYEITI